jgi:hypothetical protein
VPSIDFLVENRYLRKKYKDPITNDDFEPLTSGAGGAPGDVGAMVQQLQSQLQQAQGRAGGAAQGGRGGAATQGRGSAVVGGIVGVTSKSPLKSLRLYNERDTYNQWIFMPVARGRAGDAGALGGGPGGRGGRGADGRGGDGGRGGRGADGRGGRSGLEELFQRGRGAGPADGRGGRGAQGTRGGRF